MRDRICKNCHVELVPFKNRYQCEPCRSKEVYRVKLERKIASSPEKFKDCECGHINNIDRWRCFKCKRWLR